MHEHPNVEQLRIYKLKAIKKGGKGHAMAYEYLKTIFGDKSLSFDDFSKALETSKDIKLANLTDGKYVDKQKLDDKTVELDTANKTITDLQATVKKFDGVDVDNLNKQITELKDKYDKDTSSIKLDSAVQLRLISEKAKNPKLAKAALDMSVIKLDGEKVLGLDEQLTKLKETDSYLFDTDDGKGGAGDNKGGAGGAVGRAGSGAGHGDSGSGDDDLSDDEYYNKLFKKE